MPEHTFLWLKRAVVFINTQQSPHIINDLDLLCLILSKLGLSLPDSDNISLQNVMIYKNLKFKSLRFFRKFQSIFNVFPIMVLSFDMSLQFSIHSSDRMGTVSLPPLRRIFNSDLDYGAMTLIFSDVSWNLSTEYLAEKKF